MQRGPEPSWMRWALPLGVTLVALVVVATAFDIAPHSGGDNAGYISLAYSLLKQHAYVDLFDPAHLAHTKYPPVFPAVLAGLMLLGVRGWIGLKSAAAVPTVAAVLLAYLWARRRMGSLAAAGVALVVAFSSAFVYYSHWVLSDPLFVALTMLALWALDHGTEARSAGHVTRGSTGGGAEDGGASRPGAGWLALGVASAGLAYFTRSAGIPLLVAILAWMGMRRRWRALAVSGASLGIPVLLWWLRARSVAGEGYVSEFWLVDPYNPDLGRVGVGGLLARMGTNLVGYVGTHIPMGIVGAPGGAVHLLGIALVALAVVGWWRALRSGAGPSELFLPLYTGLILLWPAVWSGDRFALPLIPLLLGYAAVALASLGDRLGRGPAMLMGAAGFLLLTLPALKSWMGSTREASACSAVVRARGSFGCYGSRVETFVDAARWSGANLPEGAAVLSRKPRIFYVMSGLPSRTFPFTDDAHTLLSLADSLEARYVLVDQWDSQAGRYVVGSVRQAPGAFCMLRGFGSSSAGGAQMLGILPPDQRVASTPSTSAERTYLRPCPASYVRGEGNAPYSSSSGAIPLLSGLDP
ncbi:MAG: glycosyltransferase family 39 protein [Gemmatimonadetes bacterium]|nr:glycosyltransferase family 39 protein [Gemmatimonadota bacterium]